MLQMYMYMLISPFCLFSLLLIRKQWRLTQISVYIHALFDHDVFIKYRFGVNSAISDQA